MYSHKTESQEISFVKFYSAFVARQSCRASKSVNFIFGFCILRLHLACPISESTSLRMMLRFLYGGLDHRKDNINTEKFSGKCRCPVIRTDDTGARVHYVPCTAWPLQNIIKLNKFSRPRWAGHTVRVRTTKMISYKTAREEATTETPGHISSSSSSSSWLYSPLLGLDCFFSFLILHTLGWTPWTGDQPVERPLLTHRTIQTQNKGTQTSMAWVGFELTIPVLNRAKAIHALDRAVTVIGPRHRWEDKMGKFVPVLN
jgi:hypothetical protein